MNHFEFDIKLLHSLGLSYETAKIVIDHIKELQEEAKSIKRKTLLEEASEVAGHWNDKSIMVNQYEQAQRSADVLQKQALNL